MTDSRLEEKNTLYAPAFSDSWDEQSLYPLADWLNGMAFKDFEFSPSGKPVIKIAEIKNGISSQTRFTSKEYDKKYLLKKGDMLFCWSGQPQTSIDVFWWNSQEGWLNQHTFKVTTKLENKYFFFYLLKYLKPNFIQIAINKQTTGLGHVTKGDLERFVVKLPKPKEQQAIAEVLSSLDDKIELLREQNKTLETTAQAIFKEWFVDFNFPGTTGKMIDSELGQIPEGWKVGKIEDLCSKLASGGTPSTTNEDYYGGSIDWFSTKELQDGYIFSSDKKITKEGLENSSAKTFPKGSIVMAIYAAPTVGRLGILGKEATFNQAACGFVANERVCSNEYIYQLLHFLRDDFNGLANGAAQQNLNVGLVKNFAITLPEKSIMDKFNLVILPIFKKILNNTSQIQALSTLRDILLPKLMKGEIRVQGFNK